jgi:hypothetical protein
MNSLNNPIVSNGITGLMKFFTKTPMRKYGGTFGVGGFVLGYATGKSNMSFTDTIMAVGLIGTVLGHIDNKETKKE